jgi:hypothetical protein
MPRTVIYDLKGAFGTLGRLNALYDVNDEANPPQALWYVQVPPPPPLPPSSSSPHPPPPYLPKIPRSLY